MTNLCSLPAELTEQILDGLCVNHTSPNSFRDRAYFDSYLGSTDGVLRDQVVSLAALANLCRTSKQFQRSATWRLYHTLAPGSRAMPNWWCLARTLITQPWLAALARHLVMLQFIRESPFKVVPPATAAADWSIPPEVTTHFSRRAALVFPDAIELADHLANPSSSLHSSAVQSLFIILCPAVETLCCVADFVDFNFTLCTPASLPALRSLEIRSWDNSCTQDGFDVEAALLLLDAAPGLVHLRLVQPSGEIPRSKPDKNGHQMLQQVKELELLRAVSETDELASWMRACPALEKLRYDDGGDPNSKYYQFRPGEVVEAVVQHAPMLTEFVLELVRWGPAGDSRGLIVGEMAKAKELLEARGVVCKFSTIEPHDN